MRLRIRLARALRVVASRLDNEGVPLQVGYWNSTGVTATIPANVCNVRMTVGRA